MFRLQAICVLCVACLIGSWLPGQHASPGWRSVSKEVLAGLVGGGYGGGYFTRKGSHSCCGNLQSCSSPVMGCRNEAVTIWMPRLGRNVIRFKCVSFVPPEGSRTGCEHTSIWNECYASEECKWCGETKASKKCGAYIYRTCVNEGTGFPCEQKSPGSPGVFKTNDWKVSDTCYYECTMSR